jgi:hypothetical protein
MATFVNGKKLCTYVLILTKNGFAIFWAIFSQTHLVTLLGIFRLGSKFPPFKKCPLVVILLESTQWAGALLLASVQPPSLPHTFRHLLLFQEIFFEVFKC